VLLRYRSDLRHMPFTSFWARQHRPAVEQSRFAAA
jgi:hypothetical protein